MQEIKAVIVWSDLASFLTSRFPIKVIPKERAEDADYYIADTDDISLEYFNGVRILYTGENHAIDLNRYDYCLTHEYEENDRCMRFPYWVRSIMFNPEAQAYLRGERPKVTPEELLEKQTEFCSFVCRNAKGRERNALVRKLNKVRKVNCAGPFMNNVGYLLPRDPAVKHEYQRKHCFSMAYENEAAPGYQTEKIIDAFISGSIPIYWGNPQVADEFVPASFVHARDFSSHDELIKYLLELADDPKRRAAMINSPILQDPGVIDKTLVALEAFFAKIFERGPVIQRTRWQRTKAVLQRFYGHGLFRSLRILSRRIRGKK